MTTSPAENEKYSAYQYLNNKWIKNTTIIEKSTNNASFDIKLPILFGIFKTYSDTSASQNTAINQLDFQYDIKSLLTNADNANGDEIITYKEIINIAGKIIGQDITLPNSRENVENLLKIDTTTKHMTNEHKLTVEELINIAIKLYLSKTGISLESYKSSKMNRIADENQISKKYYKPIIIALELKIISLDSKGLLHPKDIILQTDALNIFNKVIQIIGE